MGAFYTNLTLRGPDCAKVRQFLSDRRAFVSLTQNACTVVLDEACDEQNTEVLSELALGLSDKFACPVLAVLIHDDDILFYLLCDRGEIVDQYNSFPGYFAGTVGGDKPSGGDAARLAEAFGVADSGAIERVLRKEHGEGYVFETERHAELAKVLGIPAFAVGIGFGYWSRQDLPPTIAPDAYVSTANADG